MQASSSVRTFATKPATAPAGAKKVQPLSFGIITRVKDGVAFARDLGFASFGELVIFVPSPARLKAMQAQTSSVNYVDGMIVGLERDLTSVVILGNERLVKVGDRVLARKVRDTQPFTAADCRASQFTARVIELGLRCCALKHPQAA